LRKNFIREALNICIFRFAFFSLSILFSLIISAKPAYGINLTYVKHLFDITHNFSEPSDVSVSEDGHIYVVDGVNNKIKVFNKQGEFVFSFGRKGSRHGEFKFPLGIHIDTRDRIYIADSGNHRIQIFNHRGNFLKQINIPSKNGISSEPTDITVDERRNRCYVVDNNNHYILAYDLSTLKLLNIYGTPGMRKRQFRFPFLTTLDKDGYIYIVDVINTRVQVLNPEGLFVSIIGGWGVEKGEFFRPKGVALDNENRVYVSDSYMGVIQVFKSTGEFFSVIGETEKNTVKKFKTPTGIFIDKNNRLYVVEMFAQKVSVYSIEGTKQVMKSIP
jgi:DNA-binding beta-propeller fold protein YncE